MKKLLIATGIVALFICAPPSASAGDYRILHEFAGPPNDGSEARGGLISDGKRLYGMTRYGGGGSGGTAYYGHGLISAPGCRTGIFVLGNKIWRS